MACLLGCHLENYRLGTSLEVQWLGLHASNAGGMGSIPGQGTKTLHAARHGQKYRKLKIFKFKKF